MSRIGLIMTIAYYEVFVLALEAILYVHYEELASLESDPAMTQKKIC